MEKKKRHTNLRRIFTPFTMLKQFLTVAQKSHGKFQSGTSFVKGLLGVIPCLLFFMISFLDLEKKKTCTCSAGLVPFRKHIQHGVENLQKSPFTTDIRCAPTSHSCSIYMLKLLYVESFNTKLKKNLFTAKKNVEPIAGSQYLCFDI